MKKTDLELLSHDVLEAVRNRGHSDTEIEAMTPDQVFDEYCNWKGLIDWGSTLRRVYSNTRMAAFMSEADKWAHAQRL